jgi:hypothetical protein
MTSQITTAASTYTLPDLVKIQSSSFRWCLEKGSIEEFRELLTDYRLQIALGEPS